MIIEVENNKYEIIKNERDAFNEEEFKNRYTNYFECYDYIVGDIAYSKLRLKGFNEKTNKHFNNLNDYRKLDSYIKNNCAYGCRYFVLKKINNEKTKN